jgi:hypothetical protein
MKIEVVNAKTVGFHKGEYIGRASPGRRGSPLANPYKIGKGISREEAVTMYEAWLRKELERGDQLILDEFARLASIVCQGKLTLVCWCAPDPCHGDVIAKVLRESLQTEEVA